MAQLAVVDGAVTTTTMLTTTVSKRFFKSLRLLCKLLLDQIELGNYNKGTMTVRGYKLVIEKYHYATNLRHDRKQITNRIRQLKQMYRFIKDLHINSDLGRDENGWPTEYLKWWEDATEGHPDWKKLRSRPPKYLPMLEQIFEGVAVDGSSSYVAGQSNLDDQRAPVDQEAEEDGFEENEQSPMSSNSRKRASSTSTTGSSPSKKTKSPMVKMMKEYLSFSSKQQAERNQYFKHACTEKQDRKAQLSTSIKHVQQLVLECGLDETSPEYYVVSQICKDDCIREFFINMTTTEGGLAFLRR
ncbi:uncharacterized protein [Setaria viridis]|uniref:uncharacterized protein n=1 Tax=Setaria viridis TaxID=4556 RepID=UPI003B3A26C5